MQEWFVCFINEYIQYIIYVWKSIVLYERHVFYTFNLHMHCQYPKPVRSWVTFFKKYAKAQDMKSLFGICFFCYFNNGSQKSELINCLFIEELVKKGFGVGRHLHFWMNDGTASKVVFFLKRDTKKKNPPPSPSWCGNGVVVIESEENFSPTFQLFFFKFDTIQRLSISKL